MTVGPGHTQTQWMRLLVSTLREAGIRHFIVSPGSRSTPLVAALQAAGAEMHLCIDERAAAFLGLGMARLTGHPAALLCTSGTAGAHYFPAVIEAAQSEVPLVVLTADRPPELQANCSPQTINQQYLFGQHTRGFFDLGAPDARIAALRGLRRKVVQAVALAYGPHPGPVHLNVPAYKPLEPHAPSTGAEREHLELVSELERSEVTRVESGVSTPDPTTLARVLKVWRAARRPVLVCGPTSHGQSFAAVARFARFSHWPVFAEVTHPLRQTLADAPNSCSSFELVARCRPEHLKPDLVVSVGSPATSSAWNDWLLGAPPARLHMVSPHRFADPLNRAELMIQCDVEAWFTAVGQEVAPADAAWASAWQHANTNARTAIREWFVESESRPSFTETEVVACLDRRLRADDVVFVGNSLPLRVAETFLVEATGYRCLSQRGANGIDGLIAGAVGTALVHPGRTLLILGDVSALHDIGSLQLLANLRANLIVCVLDNRGGRIFDHLPVAKIASDMTPWTTPHRQDIAAIASAFGVSSRTIGSRGELDEALETSSSGPELWWCRVAPSGAHDTYEALVQRLTQERQR